MPPRRPSEVLPSHADPLFTPPGPPAASPSFGRPQHTQHTQPHLERGTILEVDTRRHSYRVRLNGSGRTVAMSRMRSHGGDAALLAQGDNVVVSFALGVPYILGWLAPETTFNDTDAPVTGAATTGAADPVLDRGLSAVGRDENDPSDLLSGDAPLRSPDGAFIGALRGPTVLLSASPTARIALHGNGDRVQVDAEDLIINTGTGRLEFVNEGGKPSIRLRTGSDQLSQTGHDEEHYTLALDLGEAGNLARFEVRNREGQALFRAHVDPNGHLELFAAGGVSHVQGESAQSLTETTHVGASSHTVTGDQTVSVEGAHTLTSANGITETTGGTFTLTAGGFVVRTTGAQDLQSAGDALLRSIGTVTLQGGNLVAYPQLGTYLVKTAVPDAIVLGTGAVSHAALYEPLAPVLTTIITAINELRAALAALSLPVLGPTAGPSPALVAQFTRPIEVPLTPIQAVTTKVL